MNALLVEERSSRWCFRLHCGNVVWDQSRNSVQFGILFPPILGRLGKMAVLHGKITTFNAKFLEFKSIEHTDWRFSPEFHADLSRYTEMLVHWTCYKNLNLFAAILPPLAQGPKILTREIWVQPMKSYTNPLRFAGVIREKPILSKYILRCHASLTAYKKI